MNSDVSNAASPMAEDDELEDGEICDDETEENDVDLRPSSGGASPNNNYNKRRQQQQQHHHHHPHSLMGLPPNFRLYNGPHIIMQHGPFPPPGHRQQQCGPSGPDRPPPPPPLPPPPLLPPGLLLDHESPRSNFWERSHGALGRFRHRSAVPNGSGSSGGGRGDWDRGGGGPAWRDGGGGGVRDNTRPPPVRYGPSTESHNNKKVSPTRKQKGRNQGRKICVQYTVAKTEAAADESFEDLLSKYKQIQLELECIRKEETALEPNVYLPTEEETPQHPATSIPQTEPVPEDTASIHQPSPTEEPQGLESADKKAFQAFNIKPIRQKLLTPAELDAAFNKSGITEEQEGEAAEDAEQEEEQGQVSTLDVKESNQVPADIPTAALKEDEEKPRQEDGGKTEEQEGSVDTATKKTLRCSKDAGKGAKGKIKLFCVCCGSGSAEEMEEKTNKGSVDTTAKTTSLPCDKEVVTGEKGPVKTPCVCCGSGSSEETEEKLNKGSVDTSAKKTSPRCNKDIAKGEKGHATTKACVCSLCCDSVSSASSEESSSSPDKTLVKVEEEEMSEMQLRLLALQSASKKWHQKEQQVMKESKDRITRASQEKTTKASQEKTTKASQEKTTKASQEKTTKASQEKTSRASQEKTTKASQEKTTKASQEKTTKASQEKTTKASQEKTSKSGSSATTPPKGHRVTTRSVSSAAALERARTRSKPLERDRERPTAGARQTERERTISAERDRARPGPKPLAEKGRTPVKPHSARKTVSPGEKGFAAKQAFRKQQLRTWKLQQQQEEKRRQEEEERRKREDEIRKIRNLSNQDEQYNRFMKLVGGKTPPRSKSRDREHRKSTGKQGLDTSGNLYQYDNYDEVAMDTDSENNSPAPSPSHHLFAAEDPACGLHIDFTADSQFGMPFFTALLSTLPPPPPPLPPPPDEVEPPPKPPFADEEEEEEMLLRETCLMSMANKAKVSPAEEKTTTSGPPSPSPQQPTVGVQPLVPTRGNLNTVPQTRGNKFPRGHHVPPRTRAPLVLPRHKSVVVQLNDSDDSDSDMDACTSTPSVFGGLEFMIKEARRTVEAAKPKSASGSEKENNPVRTLNNPVRTPEALPESKKAEYRLLKEEIASREKQRIVKEHSHSPSAASPVVSDSEAESAKATAELRLKEAEERLNKHRALLQKDEAILRQLNQQELKKRESVKAAESKVVKLKEQLLASEKLVSANKTLLKKLLEQLHRVEHRVSIKRSVAARMEKELTLAQMALGRGPKRHADASHHLPLKRSRLDGPPRGSERHFAELIAQKQRLQQLEAEYALKIQKLKEAQALHNRAGGVPSEPPARASTPILSSPPPSSPHHHHPPSQHAPPPSSPFPVPQPSLHDLTQDKLTLGGDDVAESEDNDNAEPLAAAAATAEGRRHSLRQSNNSFTKPKLEQLGSTPTKDGGSSNSNSSSTVKPAKAAVSSAAEPSELFAGLHMEALKKRDKQQARMGDLLLSELHKLGGDVVPPPAGKMIPVDVEAISGQTASSTELKPVPFGPYRSPLLVFKSYRFSPYYRTKEKLSLSSVTFSNAVEPKKSFCRFDLTGTCNDDDCRWQHMRNCSFTGNRLFQDVLSYNLTLIGCTESSSNEDIRASTEKYIKSLFGANKDRMGIDQKAVLLVSKVNESKKHVPPYTTCKEPRLWKPTPSWQAGPGPSEDSEDESTAFSLTPRRYDKCSKRSLLALDAFVSPGDKRYFVSETDDISNLETSVLENPRDAQLWIKLAYKYLSQDETSASECLDAALNTLSRALEDNCSNPEIWCQYLSLFTQRGTREEVQEMCEMAVEHAPSYQVWWNYLTLERSFEGKDYVCDRLLQYLLSEAVSSSCVADRVSFQLLEVLLHRVHLNLFTGRMGSALAILQNALKSANERSIADHLTTSDRALVWLSYIHLTEFDRLPAGLYDPANSGPSRVLSTEAFRLPWRSQQDISTPPDILIALFEDAIRQCTDESLPQSERTLACMPLHSNLIFLYNLLERFDVGVRLCASLLELCPESCALRDSLAELHIRKGDSDQAVSMWLHALVECPHNAEVFYHSCKFLMAQEKSSAIVPLFRGFILSLCEDEQSQKQPVDVLRHILGVPTEEMLRGPVIKKHLQEQIRHQMPYLHLVHCHWQWLHGTLETTVDAFERALGSAMQLHVLHKLWMDYLLFTSSKRADGRFSVLVQRCLETVPSRLEVPFSPATFWSCYRFHNKVVTHYLSCLHKSQHAVVLERLRYSMPNNTELGLRLLHQEWQDGNIEHLKFQARMLTSSIPKCLASWKIAIAVERELKEPSEVRNLYRQALQSLPLCATIWKDCLLFEAAEGGKTDRLRKLVDKAREVGVSLSETLNLGPGRVQGEDS